MTGLKLRYYPVSETRRIILLSDIAAGLRLGAPIMQSLVCVLGQDSRSWRSYRGLSCRFGFVRHPCHNQVNNVICQIFVKLGTLVTHCKRPDVDLPCHAVAVWLGVPTALTRTTGTGSIQCKIALAGHCTCLKSSST